MKNKIKLKRYLAINAVILIVFAGIAVVFSVMEYRAYNHNYNEKLEAVIALVKEKCPDISDSDIIICIITAILITLLYIISYNKIFAITFDEKFAKSIGINTNLYNMIFASLCSVVVVLGMRLMGALLISSLIIFPTLSSWQIFNKFKSVIISSIIIGIISFTIGLISSYMLETPTGSTIVITNLIILILTIIYKKIIIYFKQKNKLI